MPKLLNLRFPGGCYYFNYNNTELKRSSKLNFPVSKRHFWAVVGQINSVHMNRVGHIAAFPV